MFSLNVICQTQILFYLTYYLAPFPGSLCKKSLCLLRDGIMSLMMSLESASVGAQDHKFQNFQNGKKKSGVVLCELASSSRF